MKALHVKVLFVSPLKSDDFRNNQQMIDEFVQAGIKIMMMTAAEEWDGKSDLSFNQLHEIEIEDLLPRDKIEVDMNAIGAMLKGKRVLITGAAGSIGSEWCARWLFTSLPNSPLSTRLKLLCTLYA